MRNRTNAHVILRFPQKHEFRNILMQDKRLHNFIIITIIVLLEHDTGIRRENVLGDPLLDDLRALVEFARAGSTAGAADRLFRTPSAICRLRSLSRHGRSSAALYC